MTSLKNVSNCLSVPGIRAVAVLLVVLGVSGSALGGSSEQVFVFQASNQSGTGTYVVRFEDGTWDPVYQKLAWALPAPTPIVDPTSGNTVCTLRSASVTNRRHCRLNLVFEVDAGSSATQIVVSSAELFFPELSATVAEGQTTGSLAASDLDNNGASVAALGPPGTGVVLAQLNGLVPEGTTFAGLVGGVTSGVGGTATSTQSDPPAGYRLTGCAVSSISLQVGLLLSANDRAHVFAKFWVRPEPSCTDDNDGDGTPDCVDDCPGDFNKVEPGACGCGAADVDSDADGVLDCADECPNDPNKVAPGACGCGVDDVDANGDGVPDCPDQGVDVSPNTDPESSDADGGGGQSDGGGSTVWETSGLSPEQDESSDGDDAADSGVNGGQEDGDSNGAVAGAQDLQGGSGAVLTPFPVSLCGAGVATGLTLSLMSLVGLKSARRLNRRHR